MTGLVLVFGLGALVAVFLLIGNLARIADAIERQNEHYGIGQDTPAEATEEEPA